jgi:hypothetical protein
MTIQSGYRNRHWSARENARGKSKIVGLRAKAPEGWRIPRRSAFAGRFAASTFNRRWLSCIN